MKIRVGPMCIAAAGGFVVNLVLNLIAALVGRSAQSSIFGMSQQDKMVVLFASAVFFILGFATNAGAGALYFWLNRDIQLTVREGSLGACLAGALSAVAALLVSSFFSSLTLLAGTQTPSSTTAIALLFVMGFGILIGGAFGALAGWLGSWVARRFFIGRAISQVKTPV